MIADCMFAWSVIWASLPLGTQQIATQPFNQREVRSWRAGVNKGRRRRRRSDGRGVERGGKQKGFFCPLSEIWDTYSRRKNKPFIFLEIKRETNQHCPILFQYMERPQIPAVTLLNRNDCFLSRVFVERLQTGNILLVSDSYLNELSLEKNWFYIVSLFQEKKI